MRYVIPGGLTEFLVQIIAFPQNHFIILQEKYFACGFDVFLKKEILMMK